MRAPYHETLYALMQLEDVERIEGLVQKGDRIEDAAWVGYAVGEPKRLRRAYRDYQAELRERPRDAGPWSAREADLARRLLAKVFGGTPGANGKH